MFVCGAHQPVGIWTFNCIFCLCSKCFNIGYASSPLTFKLIIRVKQFFLLVCYGFVTFRLYFKFELLISIKIIWTWKTMYHIFFRCDKALLEANEWSMTYEFFVYWQLMSFFSVQQYQSLKLSCYSTTIELSFGLWVIKYFIITFFYCNGKRVFGQKVFSLFLSNDQMCKKTVWHP